MGHVPESLVRCVGDPERFLEEAWATRPHLHERSGDDDYSDLLSLDHVDHILSTTSLRAPAFRLVKQGRQLPTSSYTRSGTVGGRRISDLPDVGRIFDHFHDGATIVLQGLHRYWEPVTRLTRELELFLTQPLQANAYITPPVSAGLNVHHDTHDVFALQTYGRKHWVVYEPVIEAPVSSQRWSSDGHDPGEPILDLDLEPGDCLYVPRGTPHAAATVEVASVHLTVGVRSVTWHDVFAGVIDRAKEDRAFREALPAGYARDTDGFAATVAARLKDLAAWLEDRDPTSIAERAADDFWSNRSPYLVGQLRQVLALDHIGQDTRVRRRWGSVARLAVADDRAELELGDRTVTLPRDAAPVLRRVLDREGFAVSELTELDPESRTVLVRRLVREGLLEVEDGGDARPTTSP